MAKEGPAKELLRNVHAVPAPVIPAPVILAPVIPAPVIPAPVILAPVILAPVIPAPAIFASRIADSSTGGPSSPAPIAAAVIDGTHAASSQVSLSFCSACCGTYAHPSNRRYTGAATFHDVVARCEHYPYSVRSLYMSSLQGR